MARKQTYVLDESTLLDLAIKAMREHYSDAGSHFDKAVTAYVLNQRKVEKALQGVVKSVARNKTTKVND